MWFDETGFSHHVLPRCLMIDLTEAFCIFVPLVNCATSGMAVTPQKGKTVVREGSPPKEARAMSGTTTREFVHRYR